MTVIQSLSHSDWPSLVLTASRHTCLHGVQPASVFLILCNPTGRWCSVALGRPCSLSLANICAHTSVTFLRMNQLKENPSHGTIQEKLRSLKQSWQEDEADALFKATLAVLVSPVSLSD